MATARREDAQDAEQLLIRLGLLTLPVDPVAVAEKLGIEVNAEDLPNDISGLLLIKGKKATIAVNSKHNVSRKRFTVAHECGHFICHVGKSTHDKLFVDSRFTVYSGADKSYARSGHHSTEEREANAFAGALLMPESLLKDQIQKLGLDLLDEEDVARLALAFAVSEQAMAIRLRQLSLLPD